MIRRQWVLILIELVLILFVLHYFTQQSQVISMDIISHKFASKHQSDQQQFNRSHEPFTSLPSVLFVQYAFIFLVSSLLIIAWNVVSKISTRPSTNKEVTHQQDSIDKTSRSSKIVMLEADLPNKQNETSSVKDLQEKIERYSSSEVQLPLVVELSTGLFFFLSTLLFSKVQQSLNIAVLLSCKYLNSILIVIFIFLGMRICDRENKSEGSASSSCRKLMRSIFSTLIVVLSSIIIKLVNELSFQYQDNFNIALNEKQSSSNITLLAIVLASDIVLYCLLYWVKHRYSRVNSLRLCNLVSKYAGVFFGVYIIYTGQICELRSFLMEYSQLLAYLIKLSLCNFMILLTLCYSLLHYQPHLFLTVLVTKGIFGKAIYFMVKSMCVMSVPYYAIFFVLFVFVKQKIRLTISQNDHFNLIKVNSRQNIELTEYSTVLENQSLQTKPQQ